MDSTALVYIGGGQYAIYGSEQHQQSQQQQHQQPAGPNIVYAAPTPSSPTQQPQQIQAPVPQDLQRQGYFYPPSYTQPAHTTSPSITQGHTFYQDHYQTGTSQPSHQSTPATSPPVIEASPFPTYNPADYSPVIHHLPPSAQTPPILGNTPPQQQQQQQQQQPPPLPPKIPHNSDVASASSPSPPKLPPRPQTHPLRLSQSQQGGEPAQLQHQQHAVSAYSAHAAPVPPISTGFLSHHDPGYAPPFMGRMSSTQSNASSLGRVPQSLPTSPVNHSQTPPVPYIQSSNTFPSYPASSEPIPPFTIPNVNNAPHVLAANHGPVAPLAGMYHHQQHGQTDGSHMPQHDGSYHSPTPPEVRPGPHIVNPSPWPMAQQQSNTSSLPSLERLSISNHQNGSPIHEDRPPALPRRPAQAHVEPMVRDGSQSQARRRRTRHNARCASCAAFPIRGEFRWHCEECPDVDICTNCKEAEAHVSSHALSPLAPWAEVHHGYRCSSCKTTPICGVRRECEQHDEEDICEACFRDGRCCKGPFIKLYQSSLGVEIEKYGGVVEIPPDWQQLYQLTPTVATYHLKRRNDSDGWFSQEGRREFYRKPQRERTGATAKMEPAYSWNPDVSITGHKLRWTFKSHPEDRGLDKEKLWEYSAKMDPGRPDTHVLGDEFFSHRSGHGLPGGGTKFRHGPTHDSLCFTGPNGRQFRWLTNRPVSSLDGDRYDAQLYALFEQVSSSGNGRGSGYSDGANVGADERLVADFAWWDGHHDLPDTVCRIRNTTTDHALVLATLAVLLTHQWRVLAAERELFKADVKQAQRRARLTELGRLAYWKESDGEPVLQGKGGGGGGHGDKSRAKKAAAAVAMSVTSVEAMASTLEIINKLSGA